MTVVSELKKLVKTITGKDATGNTIDELIAELNADYPEGGGAAPTHDVITLTGTVDVDTFEITLPSGAFTDVSNAVSSHKAVKISASDTNGIVTAELYLTMFYGGDFCVFSGRIVNGDTDLINDVTYILDDEDAMTLAAISEQLPSVSASDNGKVLGVNNGSYALVAPTLVVHGTISGTTATITDDISLADIVAVAAAGKTVYFDSDSGDGGYQRHILCAYASNGADYGVTFSTITLADDAEQVTRLACEYVMFMTVGDPGTGVVYKKIIETV